MDSSIQVLNLAPGIISQCTGFRWQPSCTGYFSCPCYLLLNREILNIVCLCITFVLVYHYNPSILSPIICVNVTGLTYKLSHKYLCGHGCKHIIHRVSLHSWFHVSGWCTHTFPGWRQSAECLSAVQYPRFYPSGTTLIALFIYMLLFFILVPRGPVHGGQLQLHPRTLTLGGQRWDEA